MTDIDRRTLIGAACLGCATLAGCGSSDSDTASSPASSTGAASSAAPGSAAPSGAASSPTAAEPSPTASATGGAPAGAGLATLSAIPVGSAIAAKSTDGKPIIVARPTETTAVAFSARCTHAGCSVAVAGAELKCPCHGSVFEATTGKVLKPPARTPLPSVPVTVNGDQVVQA